MNKLQCYAILYIPEWDYLGYNWYYKQEFFNCEKCDFNISNTEGLIEWIKNVLKIDKFDLIWSILDEDHFKEVHNLE